MEISVLALSSEGDIRDRESIRAFGDKGVFVARIEQALLDGEADIAVHSLKDLPVVDRDGLVLFACLPRADPRDVLVAASGQPFSALRAGSRIGTSSARRCMQLQELRPDLIFLDIRGNVDTRLAKLRDGQYDAIVLAAAGLARLERSEAVTEYLSAQRCVPAPGQGIVVLQCRAEDPLIEWLGQAGDAETSIAGATERRLASELGADCTTPFGALATLDGSVLTLTAAFAGGDGRLRRAAASGPARDSAVLVHTVAQTLMADRDLRPCAEERADHRQRG